MLAACQHRIGVSPPGSPVIDRRYACKARPSVKQLTPQL